MPFMVYLILNQLTIIQRSDIALAYQIKVPTGIQVRYPQYIPIPSSLWHGHEGEVWGVFVGYG